MKTKFGVFFSALALFLLSIAVVHGQGSVTLAVTQVDTSHFPQIEVYVSATDPSGKPVRNLPPDAFQLKENGQTLKVSAATRAGEQGSVNTVLVIDRSGSMLRAGKMDGAKKAASTFVNLMRPGDRTALIQFDTEIEVMQPLTEDKAGLLASIQKIAPRGGNTSIYDALDQANKILAAATGRKAIILLTDGLDNSSKIGRDVVVKQAGDNGLSISTIGLGNKASGKDMEGIDESVLQALATASYGTYAFAPDASQLNDLYQQLSARIQNEYRLTYTSPGALRDGVRRNIVVTAPGVAEAQVAYNPGGVIPEVAGASSGSSWLLFVVALVLLVGLVFAPAGLSLVQARRAPPPHKSRVKLTAAEPEPPVRGTAKSRAASSAPSPKVQADKKVSASTDAARRKMPWDEGGDKH